MMKCMFRQFDSYAERMRRSSREIVIAAVLTVAAFAFLVAAMLGSRVVNDAKVGAIASDKVIIK